MFSSVSHGGPGVGHTERNRACSRQPGRRRHGYSRQELTVLTYTPKWTGRRRRPASLGSSGQDAKTELKSIKALRSWKNGKFQNCRHVDVIGTGLWRLSVLCEELGVWNRGEKEYWFRPNVCSCR